MPLSFSLVSKLAESWDIKSGKLVVGFFSSHLNAASSAFLLKASATWLVRPSLYSSTISIKLGKFLLLALFWREFPLGQEVTRRHIIRLDHESWPASTFSSSALLLSSPSLGPRLSVSLSFRLSYATGLPYCTSTPPMA